MSIFKRELMSLDIKSLGQEDVINLMYKKLYELGYVTKEYREAILLREKEFPTGLPTEPEAVAIPHVDSEYICKPFIYFVRLQEPINWYEMGSDNIVSVKYIFALGFNDEINHISGLQNLIDKVQNDKFMRAISTISNSRDMTYFLNKEVTMEEIK